MGKCLLGLSARWHEPNTHCCTTLTHSHTHIHAPTFHLKSIGHHQRQRRQQQQPIWGSTKQNTTQKHWDWEHQSTCEVTINAFPSSLTRLSPSYWTIFILIYLYLYMEYLYIIFYLLTLMTIWHTCYLYISIWPTETKWSLKQPTRPTDTLDQQQQPGYLHSFPLTSWKHLFFKKDDFIKQILLYLFWSDV